MLFATLITRYIVAVEQRRLRCDLGALENVQAPERHNAQGVQARPSRKTLRSATETESVLQPLTHSTLLTSRLCFDVSVSMDEMKESDIVLDDPESAGVKQDSRCFCAVMC